MPSDDYAPLGGGGALKLKGAKVDKKKKKKKTKTDLVKNISGPDESSKPKTPDAATEDREQDDAFVPQKTEAEQRHEEIRRKRLLEMAEKSGSRPELLKTHKERVEELNTYLSKLSEHHDMPKIGPG